MEIINPNLNSSMKYFSFEGMSKSQIIDKYEELLFQRENQITDISLQLGNLHTKNQELTNKINNILSLKKNFDERIITAEKKINNERNNKEIMYIKLNNLMKENDNLEKVKNGEFKFEEKKNKKKKKKDEQGNKIFSKSDMEIKPIGLYLKELNKDEEKMDKSKTLINLNDTNSNNNINIIKEIQENNENKKDNNQEESKNNLNNQNENIILDEKNKIEENKNNLNVINDKNEEKKIENIEKQNLELKKSKTLNLNEEKKKKKKKHKKNKDKKNKKLASESLDYEPVFK